MAQKVKMGDKAQLLEKGLIVVLGAEVIRLHYGKQLRGWSGV